MKKILQHLQSWCGCYCILLLLLILVILLGMRNTNNNSCYRNGRYQIASNGNNACWVIDTKTSQLWLRNIRGGYDLGTNSNPHNARDRKLQCTGGSVWDEALRIYQQEKTAETPSPDEARKLK